MIPKLLIVGCGDIGIRTGQLLTQKFEQGIDIYGLRRNQSLIPGPIKAIGFDLNSKKSLQLFLPGQITHALITLVPNDYSAAGYRQTFGPNLNRLLSALAGQPLQKLIFVSSTSVYGQNHGEWVDEESATEPALFNGEAIVAAEQRVWQAFSDAVVVRFSGIYGPGRDRLLNRVRAGDYGYEDNGYSNRIHADDCAGVLTHLLLKSLANEPLERLYLASDCEPVPLATVKHWLAEQLGLAPPPLVLPKTLINKRCSNEHLLESGYQFIYPTFKEGFQQLLK